MRTKTYTAVMMSVAMIGAAALSGCDTVKAPVHPAPDPVAMEGYPNVVMEPALSPWLVMSRPVAEKDERGILKVSVPVRLKSDQGQFTRVQYRYTFFEKAGVPLRAQTDWRYQRVEPRNQVFLTGNSLDAAMDWRLEIRLAR